MRCRPKQRGKTRGCVLTGTVANNLDNGETRPTNAEHERARSSSNQQEQQERSAAKPQKSSSHLARDSALELHGTVRVDVLQRVEHRQPQLEVLHQLDVVV